jgi:hypothetical protein
MTSQQNFGQDPENFELPFSTDPQGLISYQPDTHLPIVRDLENISGFCRNSSRSQHVHQVTESNDVGNLQPRQRSKRTRPNSNSIHDEQISEIISLLSQATAEDIKKVLLYLRGRPLQAQKSRPALMNNSIHFFMGCRTFRKW